MDYPVGNRWFHNSVLSLFLSLFLGLIMAGGTVAADNPDELYRQGRFAEAEEGYTQLEMDHPKNIRYRYNRGCAAYQNSDYQGALAAFSSVLKGGTDEEVLFRAAFNLGNIVYEHGDFASAATYYKQAIAYNPANKEVRHNLELTLIELKKQENLKNRQGQQESDQREKEKGAQEGQLHLNWQTPKEKWQTEGSSQGPAERDSASSADQDESQPSKETAEQEGAKSERDNSADLSGNLQAFEGLPEGSGNTFESAMAAIDRTKAEALLESVKEDRSKYLRFQIPPEKRGGVQSGKDW